MENLLISASLQVEHLTSNCNSTSQLLRLTKITLQKLHIPRTWPFSPPLQHNIGAQTTPEKPNF